MRHWTTVVTAVACGGVIVTGLCVWAPRSVAAEGVPWAKGTHWLSLRAGYAKSTVEGAADGSFGGGFGFTTFRNSKWAWGAHVQWDLLGRYGGSAEIEAPWTVEITRHYKWKTMMRPYLGVGGGVFYHKLYRTGADAVDIRPGGYLVLGANTPISDRSLIGADLRVVYQTQGETADPVFFSDKKDATHWSAKLTWSRFE